jgi:hypothetical protein
VSPILLSLLSLIDDIKHSGRSDSNGVPSNMPATFKSLCQLLKMVGQLLDTPKARAHMDVYFTRMKELGSLLP